MLLQEFQKNFFSVGFFGCRDTLKARSCKGFPEDDGSFDVLTRQVLRAASAD